MNVNISAHAKKGMRTAILVVMFLAFTCFCIGEAFFNYWQFKENWVNTAPISPDAAWWFSLIIVVGIALAKIGIPYWAITDAIDKDYRGSKVIFAIILLTFGIQWVLIKDMFAPGIIPMVRFFIAFEAALMLYYAAKVLDFSRPAKQNKQNNNNKQNKQNHSHGGTHSYHRNGKQEPTWGY